MSVEIKEWQDESKNKTTDSNRITRTVVCSNLITSTNKDKRWHQPGYFSRTLFVSDCSNFSPTFVSLLFDELT